jgi:serralysin
MNPGGWMDFSTSQLADLNAFAPSKPLGEIFARGDIYNALEFNGDARSLIDNIITGSGADTIIGNAANNTINAGAGNDTLNGGQGADKLSGGPGSDQFVFDAAALTDAQAATSVFDEVTDYDQGNNGSYSLAEGDQFGLSAVLSAAYNNGSGQPVSSLVQAIEDLSGTFATLQIDPDGTVGGVHWLTIAKVDGLHIGDSVNVILGASLPAGATITVSSAPNLVPHSDFNGDGKSDILWQNDTGEGAIWWMNGSSVIGGGSPGNPGSSWHVKGTGDFNGDARSDILWQNSSGEVVIWETNGTSVIGGGSLGNPGTSWHAISTGYFNADGFSDVLWQNDNGAVAIWEMSDTTPIGGGAVAANPGSAWQVVSTGDFNGDGHSDILYQNSNGDVAIWDMNGTAISGGGEVANPGTAWRAVTTGDYNSDGKSDILFQNSNGQAAIWLVSGTTIAGGGLAGPDPGTSWHLQVG